MRVLLPIDPFSRASLLVLLAVGCLSGSALALSPGLDDETQPFSFIDDGAPFTFGSRLEGALGRLGTEAGRFSCWTCRANALR